MWTAASGTAGVRQADMHTHLVLVLTEKYNNLDRSVHSAAHGRTGWRPVVCGLCSYDKGTV